VAAKPGKPLVARPTAVVMETPVPGKPVALLISARAAEIRVLPVQICRWRLFLLIRGVLELANAIASIVVAGVLGPAARRAETQRAGLTKEDTASRNTPDATLAFHQRPLLKR
jgi:hypothetical protein